jgi:hypothetical protein
MVLAIAFSIGAQAGPGSAPTADPVAATRIAIVGKKVFIAIVLIRECCDYENRIATCIPPLRARIIGEAL